MKDKKDEYILHNKNKIEAKKYSKLFSDLLMTVCLCLISFSLLQHEMLALLLVNVIYFYFLKGLKK